MWDREELERELARYAGHPVEVTAVEEEPESGGHKVRCLDPDGSRWSALVVAGEVETDWSGWL